MPLDLTWPDYRLGTVTFAPRYFNRVSGSNSFTGIPKIIGATSVAWQAEIMLAQLGHDVARDLGAFLTSLKGGYNRVLLYDGSREMRGTGAVSSCNIDQAASAAAESITLSNLLPNQISAFRRDDLIGVGGNPYLITNDAPSDNNGRCTIMLSHGLRMGVDEGDSVVVKNPTGRFVMMEGFESTYLTSGHAGGNKLVFREDPYVV